MLAAWETPLCTGKTHLLCSAAVVATPLLAITGRLTLLPVNPGQILPGVGLLLVGVIGGLFPDLDAPESELLHAPKKLAHRTGRIAVSALGLPKISLLRLLVYGLFWLPGALVGGLVAGLSLAIRSVSHHRGLTHELRGLLLFTGILLLFTAGPLLLWRLPTSAVLHITLLIGAVWMLGYLTHLLLDAATISGIPLLTKRRMFHLLPRGRRIRTGSWPDTLLLRGVASIWLVVLLALAFRS